MGVNLTVRSEVFGGHSKAWLGTRMGLQDMRGITLDVSTFTVDHVINGYIPSGTAIGIITATSKYGPYDDTAVDGRAVLKGHLFHDAQVDTGLVATATDVGGALFWRGVVREAKLPVFANTAAGEVDTLGKADVASWIRYE